MNGASVACYAFSRCLPHPLMQSDGWVIAMNAGILVHCIIAYQINLNVWCVWVLRVWMLWVHSRKYITRSRTPTSRKPAGRPSL